MIRNSPQVFAGGWKETQHGIMTENEIPFSSTPEGHFFKPDGMIIFTTDSVGVHVESNPLIIPWIVDTINPIAGKIFNVPGINPAGIVFSPDGTVMVLVDKDTNTLFQYALPIPWDILSIVDTPTSLLIPVGGVPSDCVFSRDGDFIFVTNGAVVISLPLPTIYDITSNVSFTTFSIGDVIGIAFKPEGDRMFVSVDLITEIEEFDLSTPWDITTAVSTGDVLDTNPNIPKSITAKPNGLEFFIVETGINKLIKFHLENEWHVETGSHFGNDTPISIANSRGLTVKPDGLRFYTVDTDADEIVEYSTPAAWNSSMMTKNGNTFDVSLISGTAMEVQWVNGTHCYYATAATNAIHLLEASTPYDTSTLTDPGISYTITEGTGGLNGFRMLKDEKKFYVIISNTVFGYDIPTAADLPNSVYSNNFKDLSPTSTDIRAFDIKPDGSQLFVYSRSNRTIDRYIMLKHKDISSLVFVDALDFSDSDSITEGLVLRPTDGKKLYATGIINDQIDEFDISLEFNNSIAVGGGDLLATEDGDLIVA